MARAKFIPEVEKPVNFIPSGGVLLDLVLGGGWARGRVSNIVGDRSAGKTLLMIEAAANYAREHAAPLIRYAEAEAAFDMPYAVTMGMPKDASFTDDVPTVEAFSADLEKWMETQKPGPLYILDSLDSLSDEKEMERDLGDATYGTAKARLLSEMFRKQISNLRHTNTTLLIVSQLRDKIGVTFGEKQTRSGGRALNFYASQIVWLKEKSKITKTVLGAERVVGVKVEARNKKNKVGRPFRQAEFTIMFNYGIDDENSMLDWLVSNKADNKLDLPVKDYRSSLDTLRAEGDRHTLSELHKYFKEVVTFHWERIEDKLTPPMSKYAPE